MAVFWYVNFWMNVTRTITFYQLLSLGPLLDSGRILYLVAIVCYFISITLILIFVLLYAFTCRPAIPYVLVLGSSVGFIMSFPSLL